MWADRELSEEEEVKTDVRAWAILLELEEVLRTSEWQKMILRVEF